ncbi:META domain-containing protein [Streptomyces sp. NPDC092952]|uniref:META domain-containing protein n=1 Tax=Streptomyces sp. NPDC092952 TaxID=3366018 RepID=UPI00380D6935
MRTRRTAPPPGTAAAALASLALLTLTACGTGRTDGAGAAGAVAPSASPATPLTGTVWTVASLRSGPDAPHRPLPTGAEGEARLTFGEDGSVHGTLGCNSVRGTARISGSTVTFGPLESTKMMCPDPRMELERAVSAILDGRTTYRTGPRTLTLTAADGRAFTATAGKAATTAP